MFMCAKLLVMSDFSRPYGLWPARLFCSWGQECQNGLSCPPPGSLPNPGIKPRPLTPPALAGGFLTTGATWEAHSPCVLEHYPRHCNPFKNHSRESQKQCSGLLVAFACIWLCTPF